MFILYKWFAFYNLSFNILFTSYTHCSTSSPFLHYPIHCSILLHFALFSTPLLQLHTIAPAPLRCSSFAPFSTSFHLLLSFVAFSSNSPLLIQCSLPIRPPLLICAKSPFIQCPPIFSNSSPSLHLLLFLSDLPPPEYPTLLKNHFLLILQSTYYIRTINPID